MKVKELFFAMNIVLNWEQGYALKKLVLKNDTLTFCEEIDIHNSINALIPNNDIDINDTAVQELFNDMNKYVVVILKEVRGEKVKKTESSLISLNNGADYVVAYLANKGSMEAVKIKLELIDGVTAIEVLDTRVDFGSELDTPDDVVLPG